MKQLSLNDFEENQERVYTKIHQGWKEALEGGISVGELPKNTGYVVVLKYHGADAELIEQTGHEIGRIVPSIVQSKDTLHTGIAFKNGLDLDGKTSNYYCGIVRRIAPDMAIENNLSKWLSSKDSAMLEGHPNYAFVYLTNQFQSMQEKYNVPKELCLGRQWGSHITSARFKPGQISSEVARGLDNLLRSAKAPGKVKPLGIEIAYQTLNAEGYMLQRIEFFSF